MGKLDPIDPYNTNIINPLEDQLRAAISKSKARWRTARSLSKELQIPQNEVALVLSDSDQFVRARRTNSKGEALFTTSSRYKKQTPLLGRFLGAGANTVSG